MTITAKHAKAKGRRLEQWLVTFFEDHGLKASRQPGSGVYATHPHDNIVHWPDGVCIAECKQRKGFPWATGYRWLGQADMLVVRADRDEAAFLLPARTMTRIAKMMAELQELKAARKAA